MPHIPSILEKWERERKIRPSRTPKHTSLRKLGRDYIDMYLTHCPGDQAAREERGKLQ